MEQRRNPKMIVGCDASTRNIGWAVMDFKSERLLASGAIYLQDDNVYERIKSGPIYLIRDLRKHVDFTKIDMFAIEHSFFTKNPDTGKKITMMIGAILCAVQHKGITPVMEYSPTTIKAVFAGHGHSSKQAIREQVSIEFGINIESEDECDAIAAAHAYIIEYKTGALERKARDKKWKKKKKAQKTAKSKAINKGEAPKGELAL